MNIRTTTLALLLCLLTDVSNGQTQTQTICNAPQPAGWVTTSIQGCSQWMSIYAGRTLRLISSIPTNQPFIIADDVAPTGWVTTAMTAYPAMGAQYVKRTIKHLSTVPANSTVLSISEYVPSGWICVGVQNYGPIWGGTYSAKVLRRITELSSTGIDTIYGTLAPQGWITIAMTCYSAGFGYSYQKRTIKRIDNLPTGTTLNMCADNIPSGWASTDIWAYPACGSIYFANTIKKIDGMPIGSIVQTCADVVHPGWTQITNDVACKQVGNSIYYSHKIKKTSNKPADETSVDEEADVLYESAEVATAVEPVQYAVKARITSVSPNPSTTSFRLNVEGGKLTEPLRVQVTNPMGTPVDAFTVSSGSRSLTFGQNYAPGTYTVRIQGSTSTETIRIVKQ